VTHLSTNASGMFATTLPLSCDRAVASANGMDVVSQDGDFDALESVGGPTVIRV